MKRNHLIHLALRPFTTLILLLLLGANTALVAQFAFVQPGFGRTYTGNSNLDGVVTDIESVENETHVCTVARVQFDHPTDPTQDREYLLVRVRLKANGFEVFDAIDLGRQIVVRHGFLSVELSHDESSAIIATSDEVDMEEAVLLLRYNIAAANVTDQDIVTYNPADFGNYNGIEIQRRIVSPANATGYVLGVGGSRNGSLAVVATEVGENLFPLSSVIGSINATLTGSDSDDQMTLMCGNSPNPQIAKVFRYNADLNTFDWERDYFTFGNRFFGAPLVAYNINSSTTNRNGFFLAADEPNTNGDTRPLVLRARNNGDIVWNKVLDDDTELRGLYHSGSRCEVMTTALTAAALYSEYKKWSLEAGSGAVNSSNSFTASIRNYYDHIVRLQKGWQGRALLVAASWFEPSDWALLKANAAGLFSSAGFVCPGEEEFEVRTRTIFRNVLEPVSNPINEMRVGPNYDDVSQQQSHFACVSAKRGHGEVAPAAPAFSSTVYPNPVAGPTPAFTVEITSPQAQACQLVVADMLGRIVHQQSADLQEGANKLDVQPRNIADGVYMVRLVAGEQLVLQERLVFQ